MKISNRYPKVKEEKALIIVSGKQDAVFYGLADGEMLRIDAFKVPRARHSDNEGHFKRQRRGVTLSSGGIREERDKDVLSVFTRELKERVKKLPQDYPKLFLLVPSQHKNEVKKALPKSFQEKVSVEILGNYYYRSPDYLVARLEEGLREEGEKER